MGYQWGRKDPFVPGFTATPTTGDQTATLLPLYDDKGELIYLGGINFTESGYIFDKVMNQPMMFFAKTATKTWYGAPAITSLWSPNQKTFFDPCPAGWCVPSASLQSKFNTTYISVSYGTADGYFLLSNRVYCKEQPGLFWPYNGYRLINSGAPQRTGGEGVYWTSTASGGSASVYGGAYGDIDVRSRSHSDGMSVRCVKQK